jgi:large subunit ribosomal protein L29
MKKKELNDLRNKSDDQLKKMLDKKKLDVMKIKAKLKVAKEKNLKRVKNLKKEISQIRTVIREKELMGNNLKKEEKDSNKKGKQAK